MKSASVWLKWGPAILAVCVTVAYSNSFRGTLIFDDARRIESAARHVAHASWLSAVTEPRGLVDLTFALNRRIGGNKAADYHAVNLLLHLAAVLLLYGLVRRCLRQAGAGAAVGRCTALAAALLWGVHPLTTSAVTYVAQRYEVMMSVFYLLVLYAVVRSAGSNNARSVRTWAVVAVLACMAGMLCKEVMVTAPLAAILVDRLVADAGGSNAAIRRRWPLYLGLAASWVILAAMMTLKAANPAEVIAYEGVFSLRYAGYGLRAVARYMQLVVWPRGLCFDYGWGGALGPARLVLPAVFTGGLALVTAAGLLRRYAWAVPPSLFFLILAPTSSIIPRPDPIMEYRAYLPSAALVVWLVLGAGWMLSKYAAGDARRRLGVQVGGLFVLVTASVLLVAASRDRNRDYHSPRALWRASVECVPDNARAWLGLGAAQLHDQEAEAARRSFQRAVALTENFGARPYARTVRAQALNNLGVIAFRQDRFREAHAYFSAALDLAPREHTTARRNLRKAQSKLERQP
mgnify:CR=1 FL=1